MQELKNNPNIENGKRQPEKEQVNKVGADIKTQIEQALQAGQTTEIIAQELVKQIEDPTKQYAIVRLLVAELSKKRETVEIKKESLTLFPSQLECIEKLKNELECGAGTGLEGPRGGGKTAILHALKQELRESPDVLPIFLSLDGVKEENFFNRISQEIKKEYETKVNTPLSELPIRKEWQSDQIFNDSILAVFKNSNIQQIVLILDEGEYLTEKWSDTTQSILRGFTQYYIGTLKIILAGKELFRKTIERIASPLGNIFSFVNLPPLSPEEAADFLQQQNPQISDEKIQTIIKRLEEAQEDEYNYRIKQTLKIEQRTFRQDDRTIADMDESTLNKTRKTSSFLFPGPLKQLLKNFHVDISEYRQPRPKWMG